jgi:hypothetical protein
MYEIIGTWLVVQYNAYFYNVLLCCKTLAFVIYQFRYNLINMQHVIECI